MPDSERSYVDRAQDDAVREATAQIRRMKAEIERLREEVERLKRAGQDAVRRGFESREEAEAETERLREALRQIDGEVNYRMGWSWAKDIHVIATDALNAS